MQCGVRLFEMCGEKGRRTLDMFVSYWISSAVQVIVMVKTIDSITMHRMYHNIVG